MTNFRVLVPLVGALSLATAPAVPQEDPLFGFVPPGGRTLLTGLLEQGTDDATVAAMLGDARDAAEWQNWLEDNREALAGLALLDDWELRTLASYLSNVAPVTEVEGLRGTALRGAMPRDGRDLTMRYCQSCHIITVTVTQERTRDAWLGTLNNPSHVEVAINTDERSEMADYLVLNAGIPIEQIPRELRAGGASY